MNKILLCLFLLLLKITAHSQVVTAITLVRNPSCNELIGGEITVFASGGTPPYYYKLMHNDFFQIDNTFRFLSPGTYEILVKDSNDNYTVTYSATINEPAPPIVSNTDLTKPIDCISNATVTVTATGGTAPYTYSKDGITFVQSPVFDNLVAGTYTTYVHDNNGCTNQNSITIASLTPINTTITKTEVNCFGNNDGSITINTTGGQSPYIYSLNGQPYVSSNTFTNLVAGTYNIMVRDANNCTSSTIATLVEPTLLSATAAITKPIDCINNASVTVTATGGTAPYTYSKDGITFVQSPVFDNLVAGTYTTYVKDANSCMSQNSAVISPLTPITATAAKIDVRCKGNNDGSIIVTTTGGLAPYTYSLNNGSNINGNSSMTFANLYAGTYNITVKDTNGCLTTTQIPVSEPLSELTSLTTVKNQTITINASGGTGEIKYAISPDIDKYSTNNIFSGLIPGSYIVNILDENGCYITMNAVVDPPAPLLNGQNKLIIEFIPGQTLANLIIDGQNIKWYINQNPLAGKTSKTNEDPLPLSTVIVDGTTYYASQTINGIESIERLAVTVKSGSLGLNDLAVKNFNYYPNPVKNVLTISNTFLIDEVTLTSIKGEILLRKRINSLISEIDLSNFSKAIYFLKIKSEGTEKTVKIIKE